MSDKPTLDEQIAYETYSTKLSSDPIHGAILASLKRLAAIDKAKIGYK